MASVVTVQECRWIVLSRKRSTNGKSCHRRGLQVESVVMVQECKWVVLSPYRSIVQEGSAVTEQECSW